jgi:O-antigen/teichoic acid export membrane protein
MARVVIATLKKSFSLIRLLSGGIAAQGMLSASNFAVGLLLLRRTHETQYGYFVLVTTAIQLLIVLQTSYIQPSMILRLTRADQAGRAELLGSLYRDQRRLIPGVVILTAGFAGVLYLMKRLDLQEAIIIAAATLAIFASLRREFMRACLFAYHRPADVVTADFFYCILLIGLTAIATTLPMAAAGAALGLGLAALVGGTLLARRLWRFEPWNVHAKPGMLLAIAPEGGWAAFGGGVHWLFNQGYTYLVAAMIDVSAVAALAATRLMVMPVLLLSSGIGLQMLPAVSRWTAQSRASTVLARLTGLALAIVAAAGCYLAVMWLARDWIFRTILHKDFAHRDALLMLWCCISLITAFRDQVLYFLLSRARFQTSSWTTFVSAVFSLGLSAFLLQRMGNVGALIGLLAGEGLNIIGVIGFSLQEAHRAPNPVPTL